MLYLDTLRTNPNALVTIDALGNSNGVFIKGFIMRDFEFGGRNSFNSALEAVMGAMNGLNRGLQLGTAAANLVGGNVAARTLSGGDSVSAWIASDRPRFSMPLLFLALNDGDDPRRIMRDLVSFVFPTGDPNSVLEAPMGYTANFSSYGTGCCSVRIGNWFGTPRLFVVKQMMMTISQRTDPGGTPLYVGVVMEFEAQRSMTVSEVQDFFK